MGTNGCAHSNTHTDRDGDYSIIVCDACGQEMSRVYDPED